MRMICLLLTLLVFVFIYFKRRYEFEGKKRQIRNLNRNKIRDLKIRGRYESLQQ